MNIYQKLLKIRKEIEYIQKTEKGNQGAMYVDPAILLKTIRDKMNELNLLLIPHISQADSRISCIDFPTNNNPTAKNFIFESGMAYEWIDADKPEDKIKVDWFLTGKHMQDPAMAYGSALTYTERYFLLKFFQIPTAKDDPEFFERKTKKKEVKGIGKDNLAWLTKFCKDNEITTAKDKTDLQAHYKFGVPTTTSDQFIAIKAKMLKDYSVPK